MTNQYGSFDSLNYGRATSKNISRADDWSVLRKGETVAAKTRVSPQQTPLWAEMANQMFSRRYRRVYMPYICAKRKTARARPMCPLPRPFVCAYVPFGLA